MSTTNSVLTRVIAPTAASAVITTALAVAINYATGHDAPWWQWLVVAALTFAQFLAWLWLYKRQNSEFGADAVATGERSVAVAGSVRGNITTGDTGTPSAAPQPNSGSAQPAPTARPSGATASGARSAAVAGNVHGNITTGDVATSAPVVAPPPAGSTPSTSASDAGSATATGARAAAVSGDLTGNITTGDVHP